LTSHVRPDCDALGSELGLAAVLESLGKRVQIVNGQATPANIAFLDPTQRIRVHPQETTAEALMGCDALIVLDTSAWIQLGSMSDIVRSFPGRKLLIDHHLSEDDLGAERFKDVQAEATGRLVVEAADALNVPLTAEMARSLFTALATDTGWFRFSSTGPETYHLAGRLVAAGADPTDIYRQLYEQDTEGRVRLRGLILSRLVTELQGRLVHTCVRSADYAAMGAEPTDTEDVINHALTVRGTEFAVIFVGLMSGGYKVSFRSRGRLDCSQLAQHFAGGGHRAAAGATISGDLEDVQDRVLSLVRKCMEDEHEIKG
jgi:phosphoesterase RecJ-like protein